MQYTSSTSPTSGTSTDAPADGATLVRGLARGLLPLVLAAGVVVLALVLEIAAGHLTAGQDFFAQQRLAVIILIAGMLAAVATYIASCILALRQVTRWQRDGSLAAVRGALVGLAVTAIAVLLPVLLAALLPQHPAP